MLSCAQKCWFKLNSVTFISRPVTSHNWASNYNPGHVIKVKTAGKSGEMEQTEDVYRICMTFPFSTCGLFNIICSMATFSLTLTNDFAVFGHLLFPVFLSPCSFKSFSFLCFWDFHFKSLSDMKCTFSTKIIMNSVFLYVLNVRK